MGPDRPEQYQPSEILMLCPAVAGGAPLEEMLLKRLGYGITIEPPHHISALASSTLNKVLARIQPKAIAAFTPVSSISRETIHACGVSVQSLLWADLASRSGHPLTMAVFALTLGPLPDHDPHKETSADLSDRYLLHEAASMIIETLADDLCKSLARYERVQGLRALHRFSPGYCDIPLAVQEAFFHFLDPAAIGIRLCASGAMLPSKSLMAGILFTPDPPALSPCPRCTDQWCRHRRN